MKAVVHRLLPAVLLCLALAVPAVLAPASAVAGGGGGPSLVATGLTVRPDETAEEILLRAHRYDMDAIALVVAGYKEGLGGFPAFGGAARMWLVLAARISPPEDSAFLQFMNSAGDPVDAGESAELSAGCEYAGASRFAAPFSKAAIFSIERECARLEAFTENNAAWENAFREELARWHAEAAAYAAAVTRARELVDEPLTDDDERSFAQGDYGDTDVFLFYAATTHDPATGASGPQADRLLRLIGTHGKDERPLARRLCSGALRSLIHQLGPESGQSRDLIRRAHAGDAGAARVMAMWYDAGAMGFPLDTFLSAIWFFYGATAGDALCMELRAAQLYTLFPEQSYAWIWAKLAHTFGDAATQRRAGEIIAAVEQRMPPGWADGKKEELERARKRIVEANGKPRPDAWRLP